MAQEPNLSDSSTALYSNLLRDDIPLLDVRAPIEFSKGTFPSAHNIALLDDEQRRAVGTLYKRSGQEAAIALGHRLVSSAVKSTRLLAWSSWLKAHPDAWLYCFRGGLRSHMVQQWLAEAGITCPLVPGGYKAMRSFLLDIIDTAQDRHPFIIVAGPTGSAKTHLLNALESSLDLEGLAHHRGSAFGAQLGGQPTQINFENAMAVRLLKLQRYTGKSLFIEDESRAIGSLSVPHVLYTRMRSAAIALIEESTSFRTQTILNDYIRDNLQKFQDADPRHAFANFSAYLLSALAKIQRRLGAERYTLIKGLMDEALRVQALDGSTAAHALWIERLLSDYYDPMYSYQLSKRMERVVFRGDSEGFRAWAAQQA